MGKDLIPDSHFKCCQPVFCMSGIEFKFVEHVNLNLIYYVCSSGKKYNKERL